MAAKTSSNDLVQIIMLTFFLCALFFGGWGGYVWLQVNAAETTRASEEASLAKLDKMFRDSKNKEVLRNYQKVEQSRNRVPGGVSINAMILTLDKIKNDQKWIIRGTPLNPKTLDGGVTESIFKLELGVRPLMNFVDFLYELELEYPQIKVQDFDLTRKKTKDDPDGANYSATINLVTYTGGQ